MSKGGRASRRKKSPVSDTSSTSIVEDGLNLLVPVAEQAGFIGTFNLDGDDSVGSPRNSSTIDTLSLDGDIFPTSLSVEVRSPTRNLVPFSDVNVDTENEDKSLVLASLEMNVAAVGSTDAVSSLGLVLEKRASFSHLGDGKEEEMVSALKVVATPIFSSISGSVSTSINDVATNVDVKKSVSETENDKESHNVRKALFMSRFQDYIGRLEALKDLMAILPPGGQGKKQASTLFDGLCREGQALETEVEDLGLIPKDFPSVFSFFQKGRESEFFQPATRSSSTVSANSAASSVFGWQAESDF